MAGPDLFRLSAVAIAYALTFTSPLGAQHAAAQTLENGNSGEANDSGSGFLLRGTADATDAGERSGIFSDGGIEQANRDGRAGEASSSDDDAGSGDDPEAAARQGDAADETPETGNQRRERRAQPQGPVTDPINTATPDPRANVREPPVQTGVARVEGEDPFLPVGFRAGTWQVFTRLEQALGYATNSSFSAGGEPGPFSQTDAQIIVRSDWSRHHATITADGSYRHSWSSDTQDIPSAGITGDLRLDLLDGYTANLSGGYAYTTESTSSTLLGANVVNRPGVHRARTSAELVRSGGLFGSTLRGSFDRIWYEDAQLSNGSAMSQQDRNNNLFQLSSRLSYRVSPALRPFVQAGIGTRLYDTDVDRNGDDRDSLIYDLRAGVELDLGEKLTGEIAFGYLQEDFAGGNLETVGTPSLNAAIDWSPQRDTIIGFDAATSIAGSTTAGDSGSVIHSFSVDAQRRIRDNLAVNAIASVDFNRFESDGSLDTTYTAGAGVEYWISRFLSVTGDVEYQRFETARPGEAWDSTSVRVGVALQR